MILFPNAKINLGLHVVSKRPDGFHDLETVFYPLPLLDALEVINQPADKGPVCFYLSGQVDAGPDSENICLKAWQLIKEEFPSIPPLAIYLHKAIPTGAGLGGGSADGAFTLSLLNQKYQLGLSEERLLALALQLGSDCPFFIRNRPCYATGRGEIMEDITLSLKGYQILLVNPGIRVSTAIAFSRLKPQTPDRDLREIVQQPVNTWKELLVNDFEKTVFSAHPSVAAIKETLYRRGAVYASMSGSGSTVYGIFNPGAQVDTDFPAGYLVKSILL